MEASAQRGWVWVAALAACGPDASERTRRPDIDAAGGGAEVSGPHDSGLQCLAEPACLVGPTTPSRRIASAADVAALAGVRCVYGALRVESASMVDLAGLEDIELICGDLVVEGNAALTDLRGLHAEVRGKIEIRDNPALVRLSLPAATDATLIVEDNPALPDLAGLDALAHGVFWLRRNAALTTFGPLPALTSGAVVSEDNPALAGFAAPALAQLEYFISAGDHALVVLELPALTDVGRFEIAGSDGFAALDLPQLRRVNSLRLTEDAALVAFPPLPAVESVRLIELTENPALLELEALADVAGIEFVRILHNPALSQAHAEAIAGALGTSAKIAGNAGWVPPVVCPFAEDGECDALGCGGLEVCAEESDELDCCECLGIECPLPPGGGS
jgi:hypothetical protein